MTDDETILAALRTIAVANPTLSNSVDWRWAETYGRTLEQMEALFAIVRAERVEAQQVAA